MSVVISRDYVLTLPDDGGDTPTLNNPLIGYDNVVVTSNILADFENANFPASNMANPATNLKWKSTLASTQYITIIPTPKDIDYIAIAKHNLFSTSTPISIEGWNGDVDSSSVAIWEELVGDVILPNDGPAIFQFTPQTLVQIRIKLQTGFDVPTIAVVYCGKLLILQRRIYVGHTPIPFGRMDNVVNGKSESGEFLGRIVLGSSVASAVSIKNLTPTWYRSSMDPFIRASKNAPFFFAWRPSSYSDEVGYAWMTNDPKPVNQLVNGFMSIDLQFNGVT